MLTWIREKFGPMFVGGIIAFIAFVFIFYGVFSPKATRGLHEGSVAGTVNGDAIPIADFQRSLRQRVELLKTMSGGRISEEQLKDVQIRQAVFQDLIMRKIMIQEAEKQGLIASDEEIRDRIREVPAFKKDGKFDLATYKQVLEANNYSPGGFEKLFREDLAQEMWREYFKERVKLSDEEIKREYLLTQDKRGLKYVLLTPDMVRSEVQVSADEVQKFLADPAKQNQIKMRFEERKDTTYKGKTFDQLKDQITRQMIASQKFEETQKLLEKLADQVVGSLARDSASDKKVDAILKKYDTQVKTTGLLSRSEFYIPELGQPLELVKDAFNDKSPIDARTGGKAKKYPLSGRILVVLMTESQKPDLAQFDTQRPMLIQQLIVRKTQDLFQNWARTMVTKAKIDPNPAVLQSME